MTLLNDSLGRSLPSIEAPSGDKLRVYGDILFLSFRSDRHSRMHVSTLRRYMEPPVELGQFRIFHFDGVPRGLYTWGWFNEDVEAKFVHGQPLDPEDWRSGDSLWIVDMIGPYKGITASMVKFIMTPGNFTNHNFYFRRVDENDRTRRIVHIDFERDRLSKILTEKDFRR